MATQLFLLDASADTSRGTNTAKRAGATSGWAGHALSTTRGGGIVASGATSTVTGATTGVEIVDSSSLPAEWLSPPVAADVTISGTITANIWASESNMSANVAINVIIDIVRSATSGADASNTIVSIVQSTSVTELDVTTRAVRNFTTGMTSGGYTGQTLNRGDRLRIRLVGDDVGTMATGYTFNASWNGTSAAADGDTYVTLTENLTFESAPPGSTTTVSHLVGSGSTGTIGGSGGGDEAQAQSFLSTSLAASTLTEVKVSLTKTGTPADNLVLEIQSDASGSPSGSVVGTIATVAATTITTSFVTYTYSCSIALAASTTYWIVATRSGARDTSNRVAWELKSPGDYADGVRKRLDSGSWTLISSHDHVFSASMLTPPTVVYLTDTASAVATASVDREAWTSRGAGVLTDVTSTVTGWTAPIQLTDTAGGTVVDWFTKPLTAFTLTGMAVANLRVLVSNSAATASIRCEIARVEGDGTSPTVWGSWGHSVAATAINLTTTQRAETVNVSGDDLAISNGQRLRIRVYIDDGPLFPMASGYTATFYYAGTSGGASGDSYVTFPQTLTEYASGPFTYTKAGYGRESA